MKEELLQEYVDLVEKNDGAYKLASRRLVKDKLKQYLAIITTEYLEKGMPVSKAETYAKSDTRYQQKLEAATQTMRDAEMIIAKQKSIEMQFEYWRSKESTKRAEMKLQ
jgi:hypothetical protein